MPIHTEVEYRYQHDVVFRQLTDALEGWIHHMQLTPFEVRESAMLACIHFEMRRPAFRQCSHRWKEREDGRSFVCVGCNEQRFELKPRIG